MGLFDSQPLEPSTRVVLKVDVDTKVGFTEGVPRLLDILQKRRVKASFFVAMGPDHSGRALRRLLKPGFLKKQLRSRAASAFGPLTMLYGLLLPGPIITAANPRLFDRMLAAGHEVGPHGWDHVFWHDRLAVMGRRRLEEELGQAWRLYRHLTGMDPAAFAAPGWQMTPQAWLTLARMGATHTSCTRGEFPYRPRVGTLAAPLLEIPTTLPTMDELLGWGGVWPENVAAKLAGMIRADRLNVFTLHAEVEGRALAPAFEQFLQRLKEQGVRFLRLVDAAGETLAAQAPPAQEVVYAPVAGRAGEVAWQASALGPVGEGS